MLLNVNLIASCMNAFRLTALMASSTVNYRKSLLNRKAFPSLLPIYPTPIPEFLFRPILEDFLDVHFIHIESGFGLAKLVVFKVLADEPCYFASHTS